MSEQQEDNHDLGAGKRRRADRLASEDAVGYLEGLLEAARVYMKQPASQKPHDFLRRPPLSSLAQPPRARRQMMREMEVGRGRRVRLDLAPYDSQATGWLVDQG
eukprot:5281273-Pyramimonas_sp.AAC.2